MPPALGPEGIGIHAQPVGGDQGGDVGAHRIPGFAQHLPMLEAAPALLAQQPQRHAEMRNLGIGEEVQVRGIDHSGQIGELDAGNALATDILMTQDSLRKRRVEAPQVAVVGVGEIIGEVDLAHVRVWVCVYA
jgi:hypothetical protein